MKEMKVYIVVDIIIFLLKVVGGFLTHSYTMMVSGVYDLMLVIGTIIVSTGHKSNKGLSIFTICLGILSLSSAGGLVALAWTRDIVKTSLWVILFVVLSLLLRYIVSCFYTNISYQRKRGLLSYGNIVSNLDFYNYGVILLALVLMKISKWVAWLKYADRFGTALLSIMLIVRGFKLFKNSFECLSGKELKVSEEVITEIKERKEVKGVGKINLRYYGGMRSVRCEVVLRDGISMVDVNSFVVTLQDYLLKLADSVRINMVDKEFVPKKAKVRSLKQDARNSGSRNSKKGSKGKNNKKANKKR